MNLKGVDFLIVSLGYVEVHLFQLNFYFLDWWRALRIRWWLLENPTSRIPQNRRCFKFY